MRDETYEKADAALTVLVENTQDTENIREAIDAVQKLLYRYHEATDTLDSINAKIYHFTKK